MKAELKALIKAAKKFNEYQSIGNKSKLNCAIEEAEKVVKNRSTSDVSNSVFNEKVKTYLKNNLSIEISSETNDFMTTDVTTKTRFEVKLLLDGKEISIDFYDGD